MIINKTDMGYTDRLVYVTRYIREHWTELFVVKVLDGEIMPPFFLPTKRLIMLHGVEAWILPLAPFAVFFGAMRSAFYTFWSDILWTRTQWDRQAELKALRNKHD